MPLHAAFHETWLDWVVVKQKSHSMVDQAWLNHEGQNRWSIWAFRKRMFSKLPRTVADDIRSRFGYQLPTKGMQIDGLSCLNLFAGTKKSHKESKVQHPTWFPNSKPLSSSFIAFTWQHLELIGKLSKASNLHWLTHPASADTLETLRSKAEKKLVESQLDDWTSSSIADKDSPWTL